MDAVRVLYGGGPAHIYNLNNLSPGQVERVVELMDPVHTIESDLRRNFGRILPHSNFLSDRLNGAATKEDEEVARRVLTEAATALPGTIRAYIGWQEELLYFAFADAPRNRPNIETMTAGAE